jgi:hypothetical protein
MTFSPLSSLLQGASVQGSKSTALGSLIWVIATLIGAIVPLGYFGASAWIVASLLVFLGIALAVFFGLYIYFALYNPDSLRSEHYTLQKLAIENRLGDDKHGFLKADHYVIDMLEPTPKQALEVESSPPSEPKKKVKQSRPKSSGTAGEDATP